MSQGIRLPAWALKAVVALALGTAGVLLWPGLVLPLFIGVAGVIAIYRLARWLGKRPRPQNPWALPFLWLMLTPIVTVPLSMVLFENIGERYQGPDIGLPDEPPGQVEGWCPPGDDQVGQCVPNLNATSYEYYRVAPALLSFLPLGFFNLVPFVWVLSRNVRARRAGIVAGLMGLLRFSATVVLLLTLDRLTGRDGVSYIQLERSLFSFQPYETVWGVGLFTWIASGIAWVLFAFWTRETKPQEPAPRNAPQQRPA